METHKVMLLRDEYKLILAFFTNISFNMADVTLL